MTEAQQHEREFQAAWRINPACSECGKPTKRKFVNGEPGGRVGLWVNGRIVCLNCASKK